MTDGECLMPDAERRMPGDGWHISDFDIQLKKLRCQSASRIPDRFQAVGSSDFQVIKREFWGDFAGAGGFVEKKIEPMGFGLPL